MSDGDIRVGFEFLPKPIMNFIKNNVNSRHTIPHVYHVTTLLNCQRKAYFKRVYPKMNTFGLESKYNIFRGKTFDSLFSPLFKVNQKSLIATQNGVSIVGTLDFVYFDDNGEMALFDLKIPKSTFYKVTNGAGRSYRLQVQAYLSLAHSCGELLDIHKAFVLMCAEDVVREEVSESPDILGWLWDRAFLLDSALKEKNPSLLKGPEEEWECNSKYCPFTLICKQ